jgi:hypothetical protein
VSRNHVALLNRPKRIGSHMWLTARSRGDRIDIRVGARCRRRWGDRAKGGIVMEPYPPGAGGIHRQRSLPQRSRACGGPLLLFCDTAALTGTSGGGLTARRAKSGGGARTTGPRVVPPRLHARVSWHLSGFPLSHAVRQHGHIETRFRRLGAFGISR